MDLTVLDDARVWGLSSAGRAVALQASGHRFDPDRLHHSFGAVVLGEALGAVGIFWKRWGNGIRLRLVSGIYPAVL
jgi:hypothetical protein